MPEVRFDPSFPSEVRGSRYPFADTATLVADTGLALDRDLFRDASLWAPGLRPPCGLRKITVQPTRVALTFGSDSAPALAVVAFDPNAPQSQLLPRDAAGFRVGTLVVDPDKLKEAAGWPLGDHAFSATTGELCATCLVPVPARGLQGLIVAGQVLAGDVWLVGDRGIVLRGDGHDKIVGHAVGDPNARRRRPATRRDILPIRAIRVRDDHGADFVVTPDDSGRLEIGAGTSVYPGSTLRVTCRNRRITFSLAGRSI